MESSNEEMGIDEFMRCLQGANAFVDFSIVENRVEYVEVACLDQERDVIGYTHLSPSSCTYSIIGDPPSPV